MNIVNTIGSIDDLIEKLEEINRKIDKYLELFFYNLEQSKYFLEDVCQIKYGKGIEASALRQDLKYPVYGGNGVIGSLNTFMFGAPKIIISCRGAASGRVMITQPKSSVSSNSLYLDLIDNNHLVPLYYFLRKLDMTSFCTGSAQPQITVKNIKKLNIPNLKCANYKKELLLQMFKNKQKILGLKKIKLLLLDRYF